MNLSNLKTRPGSKHRVKRLGCGESSGRGKTSGKGHKGQKARSGGSIRLGFEGGQMPLIRRVPKRGFNNAEFRITYSILNVGDLDQFDAGASIDEEFLREKKVIRGRSAGLKVLANGNVTKSFSITATKISPAAREKIESAGGTVALK